MRIHYRLKAVPQRVSNGENGIRLAVKAAQGVTV